MLKLLQKPEKILVCVFLGLALLFGVIILAQKNNPIDEERINNISVIVRSSGDGFDKGINRAALEFNADVHIVSGYDEGDVMQQNEYISREIDNGANALVVLAESDDYAAEGGKMGLTPIVSLGQDAGRSVCRVGIDNKEAGRMLGELAVQRTDDRLCYIICPESRQDNYISERLAALKGTLDENEIKYEVHFCREDEVTEAAKEGRKKGTLLVLEEAMLSLVCEQVSKEDVMFGIGYESSLRNQLETGIIDGLIVYSNYDIGYMSIKAAVEAIESGGSTHDVTIGLYVADKDNMYSDPIDKILFPIE